jgi:hypothetical protein
MKKERKKNTTAKASSGTATNRHWRAIVHGVTNRHPLRSGWLEEVVEVQYVRTANGAELRAVLPKAKISKIRQLPNIGQVSQEIEDLWHDRTGRRVVFHLTDDSAPKQSAHQIIQGQQAEIALLEDALQEALNATGLELKEKAPRRTRTSASHRRVLRSYANAALTGLLSGYASREGSTGLTADYIAESAWKVAAAMKSHEDQVSR